MIGLLQRVSEASVTVESEVVGAIKRGLLVLVGVQRDDGPAQAARLAERLLAYRVFPDDRGRMNRDVTQVGGGVLLVPQFTLAADTRKGNRASFARAADPQQGRALFEELTRAMRGLWPDVATGVFGAHMAVHLVNDGPVTFWLETTPPGRSKS